MLKQITNTNEIQTDMMITYNGLYSFSRIGIIKEIEIKNFQVQWYCSSNSRDTTNHHTTGIYASIKKGLYSVYQRDISLVRLELYNTLFSYTDSGRVH